MFWRLLRCWDFFIKRTFPVRTNILLLGSELYPLVNALFLHDDNNELIGNSNHHVYRCNNLLKYLPSSS
jgi:hypothetical protein